MKEEKEAKFVRYIIEKGNIKLPISFFREQFINKLDGALLSGSAYKVHNVFKEFHENFDEFIKKEEINYLIKLINSLEKSFDNKASLSNDDEKIIEFLSKEKNYRIVDFLEMVGPYLYINEVLEEWNRNKENLPELINMVLSTWIFVCLYEMLLHEVDRKLCFIIKRENYKGDFIEKFLNIKREEYKDHASGGEINKVLCKILKMDHENSSIFGQSSKPRLIRNKISHLNLFYDKDKDKIVLLSGEEYSKEEFLKQMSEMFIFFVSWFKKSMDKDLNEQTVLESLKELMLKLSKEYLKIERGSKAPFQTYILKLKKEAGINQNDNTKN
ncbi:MAG: hypothetical protein QXK80_02735 [Candidatus Pacearchaeota archaeon]